ncbi:MAG: hypothetical protein HKN47_02720 [Pirellulaceae bacterium]|nr:hypothetical protein [Pirellulaceae bacterium]
MRVTLSILIALLAVTVTTAQDKLTSQEFVKLHRQLDPQNEDWKSIPWHPDLLSAQRRAAEEKKLIFIWAMDGHPLGCT